MLTQLTSDQIARHWDEIKSHLEKSLSPFVEVTPTTMNSIFEALLAGRAQAWTLWENVEDKIKIYAMGTTYIQVDPLSRTKNLLIYSVSGYSFVPEGLWKEGLEKIRLFAKEKGCFKILAYSSVRRILDIADALGGDTKTYYIEWKVK